MAFSDMNDVEQELGEEKPPESNGNRTFLIIAGVLGGIMILALLSILGVALIRNIPNQRAAQNSIATKAAQNTAIAASQTASVPTITATRQPTFTPTNTLTPTNTPVIVLAPTKTPTIKVATATLNAQPTQTAIQTSVVKASATPPKPTTTALPRTGIADELGTPGLFVAAFILVVIIFVVRKLRTAS